MKLLNEKKSLSHRQKLGLNTSISLCYQVVAVICGFILPRLILQTFGSETNGLLQSITQFLSIVSFMELGVGAVIQSALYKPMAKDDRDGVSAVVVAGDRFFKRIALMLITYSTFLTILFPFFTSNEYGWGYTATLVFAISVSLFAQYYFGLMDSIILTANQQGYILYSSQIITVVANTIVCAILIRLGMSIQVVKISTSIIYLIRPLVLRIYIIRHYGINRKLEIKEDPIKQKWDGLYQHISHIVLENTDVIVLTLFSTMTNVSIYSVYHLVIYGIKNVFISATHGFQSLLGEIWAKQNRDQINKLFGFIEYSLHMCIVFLYSCMGVLILPFITVYTQGIEDANYAQKWFAIILVCANAAHCLRYPYHMMIKAAGDYKRTQKCFVISAALNLVLSIVTVKMFGLVGVAIGTLVAMLYQAIWMAVYNSKHLQKWPFMRFIKQCFVDLLTIALIIFATSFIKLGDVSYLSWFFMAIKVAIIAFAVCAITSILFYKTQLKYLFLHLRRKANK